MGSSIERVVYNMDVAIGRVKQPEAFIRLCRVIPIQVPEQA